MKCNNKNTINKINCECESCTPPIEHIININQSKVTPILTDRMYNCTCFISSECNQQSVFVFNVAESNYTYSDNGKVTINKISISYDNIGLPLANTNSTKVYYNGKITEFVPINLSAVEFQGVPFYLFNDLIQKNINAPVCCCNNQKPDGILIRIGQKNQIFIISNLEIHVYGCIDNLPFSAVCQFDILSTSQALGFSLFSNNSKLCWPSSLENASIFLKYNPVLCAECICPITNYTASASDENDDISGSFYAIVNLLFNNKAETGILNREPLSIFTNQCSTANKKIK